MSASVVATNNNQYANFIAPNVAAMAAAAKACKSSPNLYWSISTYDNYADTFAVIWSALRQRQRAPSHAVTKNNNAICKSAKPMAALGNLEIKTPLAFFWSRRL